MAGSLGKISDIVILHNKGRLYGEEEILDSGLCVAINNVSAFGKTPVAAAFNFPWT